MKVGFYYNIKVEGMSCGLYDCTCCNRVKKERRKLSYSIMKMKVSHYK